MSALAAFPSLAALLAWPTEYLTDAAEHWDAIGGRCYGVANQVWRESLSVDSQGAAAERLRTVTHADMLTTSAVADQLHGAAKVARGGASDLYAARSRVRYAVEDARAAGFNVGEDLSVTDRFSGGSPAQLTTRREETQAFAGDIRQRATQLVGLDQQVASRITAAVAGIRHTFPQDPAAGTPPNDNHVRAIDNRTFKRRPPPPPYPVNEVIAEATDLDGNHVVLRRGYYDEATQQGFGWDKAYWRHHVINPNVFKDLISHSRAISSKGGTLVYEVPISRVHCSNGLFGITDCEDSGESLTMRIVANINEGSPDVPDGGQKGAITMYPLEGGSGVVEVQPGWTLTPPWVNKNVPIN